LPEAVEGIQGLPYYGEYRHAELALMGRFIQPGAWVIEEGARIGLTTLFLSQAAGPEGHIIAYEADRVLGQIATQNLSANGVRNVTLLQQELGAPIRPLVTGKANGHNMASADAIDDLRVARLDWIRILSGDKASVILSGASETLWRLRPRIFIATDAEAEEYAAMMFLRDYGYQLLRFRAPLFNSANYNRRTDDILVGRLATGLFCVPEEVEIDTELDGCSPVP
jgi:hypothetical protein